MVSHIGWYHVIANLDQSPRFQSVGHEDAVGHCQSLTAERGVNSQVRLIHMTFCPRNTPAENGSP